MKDLENVEWATYELPNIPIYDTKLPKNMIDVLWGYVDKATERLNHRLAGNIDESLVLEDEDDTFLLFLTPVIERYLNTLRVKMSDYDKISNKLKLESLWVNFQKQHEFNPNHNHFGLMSFVIWMKIPTSYEEQRQLPIAKKSNSDSQISNFGFIYQDILGNIKNYYYNMEKDIEGYLVLFPSKLLHLVNPFFNCEDERITISGNIGLT